SRSHCRENCTMGDVVCLGILVADVLARAAGLLAALLGGRPLEEAARLACAEGTRATTALGAYEGLS
ncbi:MAG: hypothetical protein ACXVRJ_14750, partial [Gaiellaceae bacterium]